MPRKCAWECLMEWDNGSEFAETILHRHPRYPQFSSADRALAQDILYGTLRNLLLLDEILEELRKGKIKHPAQCLLRTGLYQLLLSGIPEHAAINETVQLARKHEKGLINAILRNAQRSREKITAEIPSWPPEVQYSHPEFLLERWTAQYGEEAAIALCQWNNEIPINYARIHRLGADPEALNRVESATQPCLVEEPDRYPGFFTFSGPPNHEWLAEGLIYIQDPATIHAPQLLNPRPGETVLDACAAPGGKSAILAEMMQGEGHLFLTDSSEKRLQGLRENADRLRLPNITIHQIDWQNPDESPAAAELPQFDAILLDVPCTNTGVMRRRVDARWRLQPWDFAACAKTQKAILKNCAQRLKPGGRLVYSTCSIDAEENQGVIATTDLTIEKEITILPWKDDTDGAYAALLRREG